MEIALYKGELDLNMEHGAYAWAPCSYIYATALLIYLYRWSPLPREELYDTYLNGVYKADYAYFDSFTYIIPIFIYL